MTKSSRSTTDPLALALEFLRVRERFEAEIRAHLTSKGVEVGVDEALVHLRQRRIVDDRRLIQSLIARNSGKRAVGIEKLRAELLRRGAPEEEVESLLAELGEQGEIVDALLDKKLRPGDSRAKAGRFLFSRGFSEETVEDSLNRRFPED